MKISLESIAKNSEKIFYRLRWGDRIVCPKCGSVHIYNFEVGQLHICADCGNRFSDTSGTIFHSTKLSLSQWLYAIYMFCQSTRGVSSYALARMIGVSQPTAWNMLRKIRVAIKHDIEIPDGAILDEVFIGSDWKRIPSFKKYMKATPPKPVWNLKGKDLKDYYKCEFMCLANADKRAVLGISAPFSRSIVLLAFDTSDRKEFVRRALNERYSTYIAQPNLDQRPVIITDQGKYYNCVTEFKTESGQQLFQHEICRHDQNKYASENGFSSNRLEGAFSHLKRMWRGVYQRWSREHNQSYLNEFSWRHTHRDKSLQQRLKMLFTFFCI